MAPPPKPLQLRVEDLGDVPEWAQGMLEQLNTFAGQVNECLSKGITRTENLAGTGKAALVFTTKTTAADTFPIKVAHGLQQNPTNVVCGKLERADGVVITSTYSMTWSASSGGQALISFQGLSNSTKYRVSLTFE